MTEILAISGRKQSGKNTAINFIVGMHMHAAGLVTQHFTITPKGELHISDINGDTDFAGVFDIMRGTPAMEIFLADNLHAFVRAYSFADLLKQSVCIQILGLTYEQCYGTDEQKNATTHLKWQDMPDNVDKKGPMTAREVMQYVGTNIFRKMYGNVWVDATIKRIQEEGSSLALITDARFPNEVEGVQKAGGKVIRLSRNPHPEDNHDSETALDKDKFDWRKFDAVLENPNATILEQNEFIYDRLKEWKLLPIELEANV